jgi:hypothetical protein
MLGSKVSSIQDVPYSFDDLDCDVQRDRDDVLEDHQAGSATSAAVQAKARDVRKDYDRVHIDVIRRLRSSFEKRRTRAFE